MYASILDSALFWLAPLQRVPLTYYTAFLAVLALASIAAVYAARRRIEIGIAMATIWDVALACGCALAIVAYAVIELRRAVIDWDAITYYLFSAIGMVTNGYASNFQPATVTIAAHAPMAAPPVLPTMYAEAIAAAQWLHGTPDSGVRLIPLLFLIGVAATIGRLSRRFMPGVPPLAAVLLFLTMPIVLNYMVAQALSLDMLNAFAFAMLALEVVAFDGKPGSALRVGLCATLVVMSKVTGPLLLVFLGLGAAAWYLPERAARIIAVVFCVGLLASTGFVNPPAVQGIWFFPACILLIVTVVSAVVRKPVAAPRAGNIALGLAALLPAIVYMIFLTKAVGSPATFYLNTPNVASPNYAWAFQAIKSANIFAVAAPGLPQNYGLALFIWWGAPPLIAVIAGIGAFVAIRRRDEMLVLLVPVGLFYLAFLTLFGEGDLRRLLPTAPFVALFAVYALYALPRLQRYAVPLLLGAIALSFPFCYTAQETIFRVPLDMILATAIDQWNGASNLAMRNTILYLAFFALLSIGVAAANLEPEPGEAENRGTDAPLHAGRRFRTALAPAVALAGKVRRTARTRDGAYAMGAVAALPVMLICFEPVIATANTPGFEPWAAQVYENQYYGYLPALQRVTDNQRSGSVLGFHTFGIPWYTSGRLRRVELVDSFDLGLLRPALHSIGAERLLDAFATYDIRSAIIPSPGGSLRPVYDRLVDRAHLSALSLLDDPIIASRERGPEWSTYLVYPRSSGPAPRGLRLGAMSRGKFVDVSDRLSIRRGDFFEGLRVALPAERRSELRAVDVHYTVSGFVGQTKKSLELDRQIPLGEAARDHVDIPVWSLISGLLDNGPFPVSRIDIHSVEVDFGGAEPAVVDWRAMRFAVTRSDMGWNADRTEGFFERAEMLPLSRVRLSDSQMIGGIHVFPGDVEAFGARAVLNQNLTGDYPNLALDLVAGAACPAGTSYEVRLDGTRTRLDRRARPVGRGQRVSSTASYPAGSVAVLDLRRLYSASYAGLHDRLQLDSLRVTGRGSCAVSEQLHFPSIVIDQNNVLSYSTVGAVLEPDLVAASFARSR